MLADDIKAKMLAAMKAKRTVEKEVLRVALGEIQTIAARGTEITDDESAKVVQKLVKSNRETLAAATDPTQRAELEEEIVVLEALLPKALGAEEIVKLLAPVADAIKAAGSDGQATGVAMKTLKASGAPVDGRKVAEAVKLMRA
jgi:uncharacterized protein YqeY